MHKFHKIIASGFGSGFSSRAPGTVGSIAAFTVWLLLAKLQIIQSAADSLILALLFALIGLVATERALSTENADKENKDPQWVVIDEWVGVFISLIPSSPENLLQGLLALALFRFFDITKLGPIGKAESLPGAKGIMADDIVAGLFAALVLLALKATISI